jgi:antitoxin PrlF
MSRATLTSKGQLTLPKEVRQALGLREGDRLEVEVVGGEIRMRPIRRYRAAELAGLLKGSPVPFAGLEAEREALARALAEKERGR